MKILIVDDDAHLSDSIVKYLCREGYLCEQVFTYNEAMMRVGVYEYDCVLLDWVLPDGNGLDILRRIKQRSPQTGVIIISAKDSLDDKIEGLKIGADDYLGKPFHLPELSMRVFALLRRMNFMASNVMHSGKLEIDLLCKRVSVRNQELDLTKSEYELLLFLLENRLRVVSKSSLAEHICGDMADALDDYNFIYAHVKNLKSKLANAGVKECIKTYYGVGYKWILQ
ncbi:MAG: response regulator transcription factor [Prevotellaceae bacterium]|nr:response regulator transcription factor [Prevotellaceae bacterium]